MNKEAMIEFIEAMIYVIDEGDLWPEVDNVIGENGRLAGVECLEEFKKEAKINGYNKNY